MLQVHDGWRQDSCGSFVDSAVLDIIYIVRCQVAGDATSFDRTVDRRFSSLPSMATPPRKKKVDYEALQSELKRIPNMDIETVRDLLDSDFKHVEDLRGRSPEAIFDDIKRRKPGVPAERLYALRMAVYYAETENPDPQLLQPWRWH